MNENNVGELKKEVVAQKKEVLAQKEEIVAQKKEMMSQKKEVVAQKKEITAQKKEFLAQKKEVQELRAEGKSLNRQLKLRLKRHAGTYVLETRRALSTAVLAAFAFLMALSWREYINEWVESAVAISPVQGSLISALMVTLISVVGILIVTKFLQVKG